MLTVILFILKVVGWILLALLGLVVLILCAVLFTPLRYEVEGSGEGKLSTWRAGARFHVLFHLVGGAVQYQNGKLTWSVRAAWKTFGSQAEAAEVAEQTEERLETAVQEAGTALEEAAEENGGGIQRKAEPEEDSGVVQDRAGAEEDGGVVQDRAGAEEDGGVIRDQAGEKEADGVIQDQTEQGSAASESVKACRAEQKVESVLIQERKLSQEEQDREREEEAKQSPEKQDGKREEQTEQLSEEQGEKREEQKELTGQKRGKEQQTEQKKQQAERKNQKAENQKERKPQQQKADAEEEGKNGSSIAEKISRILEKIEYTFARIYDKIESLMRKKEVLTAFITDEVHQRALGKGISELKKLLLRFRPKRISGELRFGFEDPSYTGKLLALCSMLSPVLEDQAAFYPDFEQKILEGNLTVKGAIRTFPAAIFAWNMLWNRDVRRTIRDVKNFRFE